MHETVAALRKVLERLQHLETKECEGCDGTGGHWRDPDDREPGRYLVELVHGREEWRTPCSSCNGDGTICTLSEKGQDLIATALKELR